jgi:hypothetical protein
MRKPSDLGYLNFTNKRTRNLQGEVALQSLAQRMKVLPYIITKGIKSDGKAIVGSFMAGDVKLT